MTYSIDAEHRVPTFCWSGSTDGDNRSTQSRTHIHQVWAQRQRQAFWTAPGLACGVHAFSYNFNSWSTSPRCLPFGCLHLPSLAKLPGLSIPYAGYRSVADTSRSYCVHRQWRRATATSAHTFSIVIKRLHQLEGRYVWHAII